LSGSPFGVLPCGHSEYLFLHCKQILTFSGYPASALLATKEHILSWLYGGKTAVNATKGASAPFLLTPMQGDFAAANLAATDHHSVDSRIASRIGEIDGLVLNEVIVVGDLIEIDGGTTKTNGIRRL
jgi:hypothetical protein